MSAATDEGTYMTPKEIAEYMEEARQSQRTWQARRLKWLRAEYLRSIRYVKADPEFKDACQTLLRESGCMITRYVTRPVKYRGCAYTASPTWDIEVPVVTNCSTFVTFAHEVGHQMLHRGPRQRIPVWVKEMEATAYSLEQVERFGFDLGYARFDAMMHLLDRIGNARVRRADFRRMPAEWAVQLLDEDDGWDGERFVTEDDGWCWECRWWTCDPDCAAPLPKGPVTA